MEQTNFEFNRLVISLERFNVGAEYPLTMVYPNRGGNSLSFTFTFKMNLLFTSLSTILVLVMIPFSKKASVILKQSI